MMLRKLVIELATLSERRKEWVVQSILYIHGVKECSWYCQVESIICVAIQYTENDEDSGGKNNTEMLKSSI